MGIKWKEDYSAKTQRVFGLGIGVVVGGLVTAVVLGSLWEWGVLTGARWWDVMTAFGTVGATFFSAWVAYSGFRERLKQRERTKYFVLRPIADKLESLLEELPEIYRVMSGYIYCRSLNQSEAEKACTIYLQQIKFLSDTSKFELTSSEKSVLELRDVEEINKIKESTRKIQDDLDVLVKTLNPRTHSSRQAILMSRAHSRCMELTDSFLRLSPERIFSVEPVREAAAMFKDLFDEEMRGAYSPGSIP